MAKKRSQYPNEGYAQRQYEDQYQYTQARGGREFQDMSSYSDPVAYEKRKGKKSRTVLKSLIAVLCSLLVIVGGGMIFLSNTVLKDLTATGITKDPDELGIQSGVVSDSKIKNIALFGLDARGESFQGRSDAILVLSIDGRHNKLKMTSILRDSKVNIDGYGEDKLTHAYFYGGYELAVKTINQNYHLDVTDYVTVNFYEMARIVDAFGGTKVTISEAEQAEIIANLDLLLFDNPSAEVYASDYDVGVGEVVLNGNQAVAYARIRNVGNDEARAVRQQNVMKGLIAQLVEMDAGDYMTLASEVFPMCATSLDLGDVPSMTPILGGAQIETLSIPGELENPGDGYLDNDSWVWVYDLQKAGQHIDAFIKESDSPYYEAYYGGTQ